MLVADGSRVWAIVLYWGREGNSRSVLKFEGTLVDANAAAKGNIEYQCRKQGRYLYRMDILPWSKSIPWEV